MSKIVKFDGKKFGLKKDVELKDTPNNMKLTIDCYSNLLKDSANDELYKDVPDDRVRYMLIAAERATEFVGEILHLTKEQKAKLVSDYSADDQFDFFNQCLEIFCGLTMVPSEADVSEGDGKDPKQESQKVSNN